MQQSSVTSSDSFMISTSESSVISSAIASKSKPSERDGLCQLADPALRRRESRTVDVFPEADPVVHELGAVDTDEHDLGLRGRHNAGRLQEAIPGNEDRVEHRLVEAARGKGGECQSGCSHAVCLLKCRCIRLTAC